jgi:DNA-directed RNA polymerase specialized sigma24 family protein
MTKVDSVKVSAQTIGPSSRLADFQCERERLLRLAYRMLGSFSEAEDVVQDSWLKWEQVEGGIDSPAAYLTRASPGYASIA